MSDHKNNSESSYGRIVREAKEEAFHARRQGRREKINWQVLTPRMKSRVEVAAALADYHDVLLDYHDERALQTPWEERLPVDPDVLLDKAITLEKSIQCRNPHAADEIEVPAAATYPVKELLELAKELDAIAKELGFAADAKSSRERFHIASPDADHPEPVSENVAKPGQ